MLNTHAHSCLFDISNRHYKHNMSTKGYGFDPKFNIPNTWILKIGTPVNPIAQDTHTHTHSKFLLDLSQALFSLSSPLPPSIFCSLLQMLSWPKSSFGFSVTKGKTWKDFLANPVYLFFFFYFFWGGGFYFQLVCKFHERKYFILFVTVSPNRTEIDKLWPVDQI